MFGILGFPMSIRKKAVFGLAVSLLVIVCVGVFFFHNLSVIKTKQHVVEIADDLRNVVLEIRRYEKNYLLYASRADLDENHLYVQQAKRFLDGISPEIRSLSIAPELNRLGQQFSEYEDLLSRLAACRQNKPSVPCAALEDHVRESGRKLVELTHLLVGIERARIFDLLATLENSVIFSLSLLVAVGTLLVFLVGAKIVRPLRTIERTTLRIAQGDFSPLAVRKSGDETERVMDAFNRMIAELEKRQEQLLQAKKLSSIGILASGIAHQLNNPLNNVSTSIQILGEEFEQGDPAFMRRHLDNCGQEILRAQEIVKGLLEFSRQKEFSLTRARLKDVVDRAVRLISSQVPPRVEIRTSIPEDIHLDLDSQRIQEVILNLIMNAIQAIEEGTGLIRISAQQKREEDARRYVEIRVEDTGKGIDRPDIGRIFDPFFSTKEVGAGTGLGLSIAYGIIQQHQGTIRVESEPNEGSRFIIRLPAPRENSPEPAGGTRI
jgi:two-component system, NtrC family, sensor kinase